MGFERRSRRRSHTEEGKHSPEYRPRLFTPAEKPEILKAYLDTIRRHLFSNHSGSAEAEGSSLRSYPAHTNTGNLGYFSKRASLSASSHLTNTDPRSDCTRRAWRQFVQSPAYPDSIEISPFIHEE
jgi:hypothetical protein